nr:MAG TPA: hypothetical protein [Caudoviricetes sp.]
MSILVTFCNFLYHYYNLQNVTCQYSQLHIITLIDFTICNYYN